MAQADAWADFQTRCVSALENLVPPVVAGLDQGTRDGAVTRYALSGGRVLIVDRAPEDGISACAVRDPANAPVPGFDDWIGGAVSEGRYVPVAEGRWHSHLWIEPKLEVQKDSGADGLTLRIVETRLEA
ncbi:MAG: hypothetical protein ACNA7F_10815 [Roseovarius sp.]